MNICHLILKCGLEACLFRKNHEGRMMGSNLSSDMSLTSDLFASPASLSDQGLNSNVKEKKKLKMAGFATLRRKLIRKRRLSKSYDHGKIIREFVSNWSHSEIRSLLEEYEALAALKDLTIQAELARPPAATYKQDLSTLYDFKYCTDVDLIFQGACFPVHRAILIVRSSYFRNILSRNPSFGAQIRVNLHIPGVDVEMFGALLRYIYTGDIGPRDGNIDLAFLRRLGDELNIQNQLDHDLRYLLEYPDFIDIVLVFSSGICAPDFRRLSGHSEFGFRPKLEIGCHKAILSARSPFFRHLIQRRSKTDEDQTERILNIPSKILLDENVIPSRYAKVLMHAIYLDTVDLSLIIRSTNDASSSGSLAEVEALTGNGRTKPTPLEEMMELYQIGRFLELEIVTQGCEDLILESLTLDTLPAVLRWGSQPHGSAWVYRQAKLFMCEEFSQIVTHPVLQYIDKAHLIDCLQSDFLQASELEILQAVLRWAECKLIRKIEERDLNLITMHAVARKGLKRRELNDVDLRDILSDILPLVRVDHVLPSNNDLLCQAIRRGLVSTPPSHMIAANHSHNQVHAWIRSQIGLFVRPRLFMPYYEEIKSLVEEHISRGADLLKVKRIHYIPDIANTLHVIDDKLNHRLYSSCGGSITELLTSSSFPVPDTVTMSAMVKREQKLRLAPSCQRALNLKRSSKHEIMKQIRLRIVREFNLPDNVYELLENVSTTCYCGSALSDEESSVLNEPLSVSQNRYDDYTTIASNDSSQHHHAMTLMTYPRSLYKKTTKRRLPAVVTEGVTCSSELTSSSCSEGQLSDMMPDVAIPSTTLSLAALSLSSSAGSLSRSRSRGRELELDLGDNYVPTYGYNRRSFMPPHPFM